MEREIDARRRVQITLSKGKEALEGVYRFDVRGNFLGVRAGRAPSGETAARLASLVREMPRISGREEREVQWEGEHFSLSVLRYIDMSLGELADIQAERIPDREAVVDCGQNRRLTYRQL